MQSAVETRRSSVCSSILQHLLHNINVELTYIRRSLGTETVSLYVGPEKKKFVVHKHMLTAQSKYFNGAFNRNFKEATEGSIFLEEDDAEVVDLLVVWLYRGSFPRTREQVRSSFQPERNVPGNGVSLNASVPVDFSMFTAYDTFDLITSPTAHLGGSNSLAGLRYGVGGFPSGVIPLLNAVYGCPVGSQYGDEWSSSATQTSLTGYTPFSQEPQELLNQTVNPGISAASFNTSTPPPDKGAIENNDPPPLLKLCIFAEQYCLPSLFNAAIEEYIHSERLAERAAPVEHIELVYERTHCKSTLRACVLDSIVRQKDIKAHLPYSELAKQ